MFNNVVLRNLRDKSQEIFFHTSLNTKIISYHSVAEYEMLLNFSNISLTVPSYGFISRDIGKHTRGTTRGAVLQPKKIAASLALRVYHLSSAKFEILRKLRVAALVGLSTLDEMETQINVFRLRMSRRSYTGDSHGGERADILPFCVLAPLLSTLDQGPLSSPSRGGASLTWRPASSHRENKEGNFARFAGN